MVQVRVIGFCTHHSTAILGSGTDALENFIPAACSASISAKVWARSGTCAFNPVGSNFSACPFKDSIACLILSPVATKLPIVSQDHGNGGNPTWRPANPTHPNGLKLDPTSSGQSATRQCRSSSG